MEEAIRLWQTTMESGVGPMTKARALASGPKSEQERQVISIQSIVLLLLLLVVVVVVVVAVLVVAKTLKSFVTTVGCCCCCFVGGFRAAVAVAGGGGGGCCGIRTCTPLGIIRKYSALQLLSAVAVRFLL